MILLLLCVLTNPFVTHEHVDSIEINHFHNECGQHVYTQLIMWEFDWASGEDHCRAWKLIDAETMVKGKTAAWFDADARMQRKITAGYVRETFTQHDPERANKKILDERNRVGLIKR